jgi:hypothetical protein
MTKRFVILLALLGLAIPQGRAGLLIQFDNPDQTSGPGNTLSFFGVVSNGGADTVFLIQDSLNLLGNSFTLTDLFYQNTPVSLDPGQSSDDIELFDVAINNPFTDPDGQYTGSYAILDGSLNVLGSQQFSVTENPAAGVPEPSSAMLFAGPLLALIFLYGRSRTVGSRQFRG